MNMIQIIVLLTLITSCVTQKCAIQIEKNDLCVRVIHEKWPSSDVMTGCVIFAGDQVLLSCAGLEREQVIK